METTTAETGFTAPTCSAPSPAHLPRTWVPRGPLPNFRMTTWRLEKKIKNNAEGFGVTGLVREGGLNTDDPRGLQVQSFPGPGWFGSGRGAGCRQSLGWVSGLAGSGRPGRSRGGGGGSSSHSRAGPSLFCRSSRGAAPSTPLPGLREGEDAPPARVWLRPVGARERSGVAMELGRSPRVPNVLSAPAPHTLVVPSPLESPQSPK